MFIAEMFTEAAQPQLVVLYPGRFQPFHLGHRAVFERLQKQFGRDAVFIATSNKTELPKSPFNFSEKTVFMTAAGVQVDRILEVVSPYKLPVQWNPSDTIFVVAVGAPDAQRLAPDSTKKDGNPSYFKTFTNIKECETADKHGYVIVANEERKIISIAGKQYDVSHGTETRKVWNVVRNDSAMRSEFLTQMYGRDDPEVGRILDKIPQTVNEEAAGVGVVSNSKDPRYVMATAGDQNDVNAQTLPKEMRAYGLIGRKLPKHKVQEAGILYNKITQLQEQLRLLKAAK
jgi:cytidyltransferase-like protein